MQCRTRISSPLWMFMCVCTFPEGLCITSHEEFVTMNMRHILENLLFLLHHMKNQPVDITKHRFDTLLLQAAVFIALFKSSMKWVNSKFIGDQQCSITPCHFFMRYFVMCCSSLRWAAYRQWTAWVHGHLGRKVRIPLPACAALWIKSAYPNVPGEAYVHYHEADSDLDAGSNSSDSN